jgi:hypothetical protein
VLDYLLHLEYQSASLRVQRWVAAIFGLLLSSLLRLKHLLARLLLLPKRLLLSLLLLPSLGAIGRAQVPQRLALLLNSRLVEVIVVLARRRIFSIVASELMRTMMVLAEVRLAPWLVLFGFVRPSALGRFAP